METLRDSSELKEAADILNEELVVRLRDQRTSREDTLRRHLRKLCQRSRVKIAVLSDDQGLPLVIEGEAMAGEVVSAVVTILGETLDRVGRILEKPEARFSSLDLSFDEKLAIRKFEVLDRSYSLFTIGPSDGDVRSEFEITIMQLTSVLST